MTAGLGVTKQSTPICSEHTIATQALLFFLLYSQLLRVEYLSEVVLFYPAQNIPTVAKSIKTVHCLSPLTGQKKRKNYKIVFSVKITTNFL